MSSNCNVGDINKALWYKFSAYDLHVENSYVFDWEADFMCRSNAGYYYEFEIKTSYSDFKADFRKKEKHKILEASGPYIKRGKQQDGGFYTTNARTYKRHFRGPQIRTDLRFSPRYTRENKVMKKIVSKSPVFAKVSTNIKVVTPNKSRPHKFLYVCPTGIIPVEEVPDYAGLMYFNPDVKYFSRSALEYIKQPPFLHKDEISGLEKRLYNKIYWSYRNIKFKQYALKGR